MRALIVALLLLVAPAAGAQQTSALPNFKALMKEQGPAVVNIIATHKAIHSAERSEASSAAAGGDAPPGDGDAPPGGEGLGSGFIISADGYILTNAHLVAGAQDVEVRLADAKRQFRARVIGADQRSDVALLKVDATGLPTARIGSSAGLEPGDWVAAIGSPFGFANTITAGIVSAKGRSLPDEVYVPFIQTDVAVNPGNSGGPLLNLRGEVVGINSLIYSGTGGYMGVSFAIPIEVAMAVSRELRSAGKVTRGRAGIGTQALTPQLARAFKVDATSGAIVVRVEKGGPAERAGARVGDVVLEWNGEPVEDPGELPRIVAATPPGTTVPVTIAREGKRETLALTVGEVAPDTPKPGPAAAAPPGTLGLALRELSPRESTLLGVEYGLLVREAPAAPGSRGLLAGDVIIGVAGRMIRSREEFDELLAGRARGAVPLLVRRGDTTLYVAVEPGRAG